MFEFCCLYCAHAMLHAPFPSDGLHLQGVEVIDVTIPTIKVLTPTKNAN